jgi:hypothetical protein
MRIKVLFLFLLVTIVGCSEQENPDERDLTDFINIGPKQDAMQNVDSILNFNMDDINLNMADSMNFHPMK